ncbi:MAG: LacI family DNA-binding transcriptional regulator [Alphaproteobacteria bacterium]
MPRGRGGVSLTLKDVAQEAGVSYQTVSRALNGSPEIKPGTRARVLAVAERLGYHPNRLAGSLRTSRSKVIGLVMSDVENFFFAEVVSSVEAGARDRGYSVILANSAEDIERERLAVASLIERRVDGLIIAPAEGDHAYLARALPKSFPLVAINRMIESVPCSAVLTENEAGAKEAVQYLIARGHSRIGAVIGSSGLMTSRERFAGFSAAMREAGLPIRAEWIGTGGLRPEGGRMAATKIFARVDRPTALFASSNKIAEGVLVALGELGLRHGRDVEVIGFDNAVWARLVDPPVPVIAQPTAQIGFDAVRLLIDVIDGEVRAPRILRLPARLITNLPADLRSLATA